MVCPLILEELLRAHGDEIRRCCFRWMSGNAQNAEEAFSAFAELACVQFPRYAPEIRDPRRWLLRLAHNVCMTHHRWRRRESGRVVLTLADDDLAERLPSRGETPEQTLLRKELRKLVKASVRTLDADDRRALLLHAEGVSHARIAETIGASEELTRKRVQLARQVVQDAIRRGAPPKRRSRTRRRADALPRLRLLRIDSRDVLIVAFEPVFLSPAAELRARQYVVRHPLGHRMHLRLARLLMERGALAEAAACS